MKILNSFFAIVMLLLASCRATNTAIPENFTEQTERLRIKGTSLSVIGHPIKVEGFGEGRMYSGFTSSSSNEKRLFPLYFDLDSRLRYLSDHFAKQVAHAKTQYSFEFADGKLYANAYCVVHATETSVGSRDGFGIQLSDDYRFSGLIYTNQSSAPWQLEFGGKRDIKNGLNNYTSNPRNSNGILYNGQESFDIMAAPLKTKPKSGEGKAMPFDIIGGYVLEKDGRQLGFVDIFDQSLLLTRGLDSQTRMLMVAVATAILAKNNAG